MTSYLDWSCNFHPYECDGPGKCVHCDRAFTDAHDPATCALCDPEYDGSPNEHRPAPSEAGESNRQETPSSDAPS